MDNVTLQATKRLTNSIFSKKNLSYFGHALALLGIYFVFQKLKSYSSELRFDDLNLSYFLLIILISSASNLALVFAWKNLLKYSGNDINYSSAFIIYSISQFGRYIPGNVFHIAGRQVLGIVYGIPSYCLLRSTFWELSLISFTGFSFLILSIPLIWKSPTVELSFMLFVLVVLIINKILNFKFNKSIAQAFNYYFLYLSISGLVFAGLIYLNTQNAPLQLYSLLPVAGAFVIAWLVGLVIPGAPAGVGVRELVLIFLLGNYIVESDLVRAVFMGRVISIIGDLFFFLSGLFLKVKIGKKKA